MRPPRIRVHQTRTRLRLPAAYRLSYTYTHSHTHDAYARMLTTARPTDYRTCPVRRCNVICVQRSCSAVRVITTVSTIGKSLVCVSISQYLTDSCIYSFYTVLHASSNHPIILPFIVHRSQFTCANRLTHLERHQLCPCSEKHSGKASEHIWGRTRRESRSGSAGAGKPGRGD